MRRSTRSKNAVGVVHPPSGEPAAEQRVHRQPAARVVERGDHVVRLQPLAASSVERLGQVLRVDHRRRP